MLSVSAHEADRLVQQGVAACDDGLASATSDTTTPWHILNALGDGVYGIDQAGRCTFANRAALSILGYDTAEDLPGRNMHALIHHTRADGRP